MAKKENQIERLLTAWGIAVIAWSFFRANLNPPLWFSEIIAKPFIFILPIFIFVQRYDSKRSFFTAVALKSKKTGRELLISSAVFVVLMLVGYVSVVQNPSINTLIFQVNWKTVGIIVGLAFATAFTEEIMGRGFLFKYLFEYSNNFILSFILSSILFFVLYLPGIFTIGIAGGVLALALGINIIISIITTLLLYLRRSLYLPIAVHAAILIWFDLFNKLI